MDSLTIAAVVINITIAIIFSTIWITACVFSIQTYGWKKTGWRLIPVVGTAVVIGVTVYFASLFLNKDDVILNAAVLLLIVFGGSKLLDRFVWKKRFEVKA